MISNDLYIHTFKWRESLYPLSSKVYREQQRDGLFVHDVLKTYERHMEGITGKDERVLALLEEIKSILTSGKFTIAETQEPHETKLTKEKKESLEQFLSTFID